MDVPEHCFTCGHYAGEGRCRATFKVHVILTQGRGSVAVDVLPGTVPEHLVADFKKMLTTVFGRFLDEVISRHAIWREIEAFQQAHPARLQCAAREEMGKIQKPFLEIIKFDP